MKVVFLISCFVYKKIIISLWHKACFNRIDLEIITREKSMKLTTRNQWPGIVKAVNHGSIVSEVTLEIAPDISVIAIVSKSSVEALGLAEGSKAYALIKSTEITLAID
jgi:molybdopterin-binding protein